MKVVLITGGTSGFGEAAATEMARRGWQVAVMARTRQQDVFQGDVGKDADCRRVAKAVLDKWGRMDALVNSAGTTKFVSHADLEGLNAEDWEHIFRVNVIGPSTCRRSPRFSAPARQSRMRHRRRRWIR
jgi:3-oxoacyl-[acyl-carrier protein] reductase